MNIGLTYNLLKDELSSDEEPPSHSAEYDSPETILALKNTIKSFGHNVFLIEADESAYMNLYKLRDKLDFVFNIAEGISGECRESQIPIMLEMLGIPYAGSGPLSLAITLDKARAKEILIANNISTPPFQVFYSPDDELKQELNFPLILKPNAEGSSIGVTKDSVCKDEMSFRKKLRELFRKYNQPLLAEKFLSGREFTAALIGNGEDIKTLPIIEIAFERFPKMDFYIDCYEAKSIWCERDGLEEAVIAGNRLDSNLKNKISKLAIDTFNALSMKDFGRIDIRMDSDGKIYVLEANPLPGLNPIMKHFSYFLISSTAAGMTYNQTIQEILNAAFKRYKLNTDTSHKKILKNEAPAFSRQKV